MDMGFTMGSGGLSRFKAKWGSKQANRPFYKYILYRKSSGKSKIDKKLDSWLERMSQEIA